jgi:hypothetical protein
MMHPFVSGLPGIGGDFEINKQGRSPENKGPYCLNLAHISKSAE